MLGGQSLGVGAETCLILPVPAAEPLVGPLRARLDRSAAEGIPAHITILYPFVPDDLLSDQDLLALRSLFAAHAPIHFELGGIGEFPDVLYLELDLVEPFIELTNRVWQRWPEHPPYRGTHRTVIPHLTVASGALVSTREIREDLEKGLPISARADEAWLLRGDHGRWHRSHQFGLTETSQRPRPA